MSPKFRKSEWFVEDVPIAQAKELVEKYHYARGASHTRVFTHGLYDDLGGLYGVAWWLPPTKPACMSVNRLEWKRVLSLSRMVVVPGVPKNACSFLLARSTDLIRKDGRFNSLVTYADQSQGHTGHVYRAAGWTYMGKSSVTPRWIDPTTGRQVATLATKTRTKAQMLALGYTLEGHFGKLKFVKYLDRRLHEHYCEL
jgi:hypothetical protein